MEKHEAIALLKEMHSGVEAIGKFAVGLGWEATGHASFPEAYEVVNGIEPTPEVIAIALKAMWEVGMVNVRPGSVPDGKYSQITVAEMLGIPISRDSCSVVSAMIRQIKHGVPPRKVTRGGTNAHVVNVIKEYGTIPVEAYTRRTPVRKGFRHEFSGDLADRINETAEKLERDRDAFVDELIDGALRKYQYLEVKAHTM